ncbi:MAG: hypothetical protein K8S00_12145 [Bacteroidales bacterium]|nr:hypothetical protein [Bacteroidales bacterium]
MTTVQLKYRPFKIVPHLKQREVDFPDTLSGLSYAQFVLLANLESETNENSFLSRFLGVPKRIVRQLSDNQKLYLFELFEVYNNSRFIDKVIIDKFYFQNVMYLGPADKLSNVSFGEFCFADTHFLDYINNDNQDALNKLIAVLYRPEKKVDVTAEDFNGDWRIRFNTHHTQKRADSFAAMYPPLKKAIVFNYIKLRSWLEPIYPYVFPKSGEDSKKKVKHHSWLPVLENLVGNDIINLDRYTEVLLHTALRNLDTRLRDYYKSKK